MQQHHPQRGENPQEIYISSDCRKSATSWANSTLSYQDQTILRWTRFDDYGIQFMQ